MWKNDNCERNRNIKNILPCYFNRFLCVVFGRTGLLSLAMVLIFNFTLAGEAFFPNSGGPTANDNYGFCKVLYVNKQHSITTVQLSLNLYDSIRLSSLVP